MARVAIIGASGYTGLELLRLFARHPGIEVTALVTRQTDSPHVTEIHPSLTGRFDLRLESLSPSQIAERADYAFACLPHAASAEMITLLLDHGLKVVDLSADYRLKRPPSLRTVVRSQAPRPRSARQGSLRAAGAVPRADPGRRLGRQPGLLPHFGDPRPGAAVEGGAGLC